MIFASDLDQTLIYSENFLKNNYKNPTEIRDTKLTLIEYYQGLPLCYIHTELIEKLQKLDKLGLFVPVTTRTELQYKRIEFSRLGINPKYAITTNGAKVLIDGVVDPVWDSRIKQKLKQLTLQKAELEGLIERVLPSEAIKKIRTAEDVFTYCVIHREKLKGTEVQEFQALVEPHGWKISLQGTKIYFMPNVLSKGDAIQYVAEKLGEDKILSAGDSLLDLPLLLQSTVGMVPSHGEIFRQNLNETYKLKTCTTKGVENSLEIVKEVLNCAHLG